jgi:hypothetical protein
MIANSHRKSAALAGAGLVVLLGVVAVRSGGRPPSVASDRRPVPREVMLAIDLSGSRSVADLKVDRELVEQAVEQLRPADKVVLLTVDGRTRERGNGWSFVVPPLKVDGHVSQIEEQNIADVKTDIRKQVDDLFKGGLDAKKPETNIFGTLFTVADFRHESDGRQTTLILFSDMLEDSGRVHFDRRGGIPKSNWVEEQRAAGRLPRLAGVCVTVVGADVSTEAGLQIRNWWATYFETAGAEFSADRYRQTATEMSTLFCK